MTTSGTAQAPVQPYPLSTRIAVEALGSFFIVFAGLATQLFSPTASTVAFAYGLALVACVISFGHVSNGYFNPAFSLAMAVAGRIKWLPAVLYMVAQTIGALLSAVVLYALVKVMPASATSGVSEIFGTLGNGFDAHSPAKVPMVGVLIIEIVAMAVLVAVLLGATSVRNKGVLAPLSIGLAFAVAVTISMPISNGSLNPARATSVVFLADSWALGQLWLFWLAPLFGAALAAAIYRSFQPSGAVVEAGDAATSPAAGPAEALSDEDEPEAPVDTVVPKPVPAAEAIATVPAAKKNDAQDFFDAPGK